ncbi:MAG: DegT/DnrJ/EryC1/StrS family aminotransferase [Acidobacteriota bacterium]
MKLAINGGEPVRKSDYPPWPVWNKREEALLIEVLNSGKWGSLHGNRVKEFENNFKEYHQAKYGIAVSSGSAALYISLKALGLEPGDEVIVPSYTFVATPIAVLQARGIPKFADISLDTYNLSPESLKENITPRTKGVIPVHLAGQPADMDAIKEIAEKHNLFILEDAAQAWGSEWKTKKAGAIGNAGIFSFQSSKNISSGEGGIILTDEEDIAKKARSYSNCGRLEGRIWYEHYLMGGNYRMTEFQAAVLLAQLERYEKMKKKREENAAYLSKRLAEIEGITPLKRDEKTTSHAYHLFIFKYDKSYFNEINKEKFIKILNAEGIPVYAGYSLPLYKQPVFTSDEVRKEISMNNSKVDYSKIVNKTTEKACYEEAIWLSQRVLLGSKKDMDDIVEAIIKLKKNINEIN